MPSTTNYFIGNDPDQWRTNVPNFGRVKYSNVYPGVDLVYYGRSGQLETDFVISPGADPKQIKIAVGGAAKLALAKDGDIVIAEPGGAVRLEAPLLYQSRRGARRAVKGGFTIDAPNTLGFAVGRYDRTRTLVIDPIISYSTYLGGGGADEANGIALDSAGDVYVVGTTSSADFPTHVPLQPTNAGATDAFVAELNASGSAVVFSTYLGSNASDQGDAIALDSSGDIYISGAAGSPDFPTKPSGNCLFASCVPSAFVAKLLPGGSSLAYAALVGGAFVGGGSGPALGVAVDAAGDAYIAGPVFPDVAGSNFTDPCPQCDPVCKTFGSFIVKLNPAGKAVIYAVPFCSDTINAIALDSSGDAYFTGYENPTSPLPLVNAFQGSRGGGDDAFVAELNATGTGLIYSTYLGGGNDDFGTGIAVDSSGEAVVTGQTASPNFPVTGGAFQATCGTDAGCNFNGSQYLADAFVAKLSSTGDRLIYSTFVGGSGGDRGNAVALDSSGNAYVVGETSSTDFPTDNPVQAAIGGGQDAFISELNSSGSGLAFSTFLGGGGADAGTGIAVNPSGGIYVVGATSSTNFPVTQGSFQTSCGSAAEACISSGLTDAFVSKIGAASPAPSTLLSAGSVSFAAQLTQSTSAAQTLTLTNSGTAALAISSIAASGDFAETNTCGTSLAAGANCAIAVTFTPTATGSRTGTLTVTDNAAGSPQTAALTGTGADLTIAAASGSSTSATVTAGQSAAYGLAFTPVNGAAGTFALTCAGAPTGAACTPSPASISLSGTAAAAVTVTVTTTAASAIPALPPFDNFPWLPAAAATLLLLPLAVRRRRRLLLPLATAALLASAIACGGGGTGSTTTNNNTNPNATPAGTYTLTLTATGPGRVTRTQALTLTVN